MENIQILAIPIADNRQPIRKSGRTIKGGLECLEILAGGARSKVYAKSTAIQWTGKGPTSASKYWRCTK